MLKRTTTRIALALIYGLLFLFILEISARVDDAVKWGAPLLGIYSRESLTLVDELGYRNRPNSQFEKWKINSFGFRGDEIKREAPEGTVRIMVLGASETFGLYEEPGKEFPAQLEAELNHACHGCFQVLNGAVTGHIPTHASSTSTNTGWSNSSLTGSSFIHPFLSTCLGTRPALYCSTTSRNNGLKGLNGASLPRPVSPSSVSCQIGCKTALREILIRQAVAGISPERIFHHPPPERLKLLEKQLTDLVRTIRASGARVVLTTHATAIAPPSFRP